MLSTSNKTLLVFLAVLAVFIRLLSADASFDNSEDNLEIEYSFNLTDILKREDVAPYINESTAKLLRDHGLDLLVDNIGHFLELFDKTATLSHYLSHEDEFRLFNEIIDGIKRSFITAVNELASSRNPPTGTIVPASMSEFIDRQEIHFNALLKNKVPRGLDAQLWNMVFSRIHLVFDTFKMLYRLIYETLPTPLVLNWAQLQFIAPFLEFIPTRDLLKHSHFEHLLLVPAFSKKAIHDFIAAVFSIERSHLTKVVLDLVASYDWNRLLRPDHADV